MRADHPKERIVAAPQDPFGKREIARMVVRHHNEIRVRRGFVDSFVGRVVRVDRHVGEAAKRLGRRKLRVALVDPAHVAGQGREHAHERRADVARPEQHDRELARRDGFGQERVALVKAGAVP